MLQLEKEHNEIEQHISIDINEKITINNENKANQINIKLLEEIFELNNERDSLYVCKEKLNFIEREVKTINAIIAIGSCAGLIGFAMNANLIYAVLMGGFFVISLLLTNDHKKEHKSKLQSMKIKNETMIIKIKERVHKLKERLFFKSNKKDLNKDNAKLEKHIQILKEELKFCNLWNMDEELDFNNNQENWKIISMNEHKLLKKLNKNINNNITDKKIDIKDTYKL